MTKQRASVPPMIGVIGLCCLAMFLSLNGLISVLKWRGLALVIPGVILLSMVSIRLDEWRFARCLARTKPGQPEAVWQGVKARFLWKGITTFS